MKTKTTVIILVCALLLSFALGTAGLVTLAAPDQDGAEPFQDRLIGVFITTQPLDLFDIEGYLNDHLEQAISGGEIDSADAAAYQGRLYATLDDSAPSAQYTFEGVEGMCFFCPRYSNDSEEYWGTSSDDAISDIQASFVSGTEERISLEGTIYISVSGGPTTFYSNPVYQTPAGEVYAVQGNGTSYAGSVTAGMSGSTTLNDTQTVTQNGEKQTISSSIQISFAYMDTPTGITVLQFDAEDQVVSSMDYAPGTLPESLTVEERTQYIIVETRSTAADGSPAVSRELFQPTDDQAGLTAFYRRDDGICLKQFCAVSWTG